MQQMHTMGDVLRYISQTFDNPHALSSYTEKGWVSVSTKQFMQEVKWIALALLKLGVQTGDRVGIIALPSSRWTIVDFAIMSIGGISVPLFANISEENFLFEVSQTELKILFVGGVEEWSRCERNPELFHKIISLDEHPELTQALDYQSFLAQGEAYEREQPGLYEKTLGELKPDQMATIIYTSGSTGVPKGAEHTHYSLASLLHEPILDWDSIHDIFLSILPLAHVFARVLNFILISWGIPVYYFNDIKNLSVGCREVHPTVLIVVPRLLEKLYAKIVFNIQSASFLKRWIGEWGLQLARSQNNSRMKRWLRPLADRLVYKKIREALGGRLRVVISGGAPLNPLLHYAFRQMGFPILEGWGLTESCPVSVNRLERDKIGTVGPPIPGMTVKTNAEGELLVKGEMMMRGYYRNPEGTQRAFDAEGWLRTGDKGTIDADGYITIVGRLKELLKTSTGEKIAPNPIELALCRAPFVDMAMVIADNRKFATCLLVPDLDAVRSLKKKKKLTHVSDEEFLKSAAMQEEVERFLGEINLHLNYWEKIRNYRFIMEPLTISGGDLTPSMKIRRDAVEKKYKDLIESMYLKDGL